MVAMHRSIDPKNQYCKCGYSWRPGTISKIIMLLYGSYTKTCPQCQSKLRLKLVHYVICDKCETILDEEIWKNG